MCRRSLILFRRYSRRRITGVEYLDAASGEKKKVFAGTVVVCSGAYESPKLLMLSKSRHWENGIGNDHDLLGRYVVSHSMLKVRGASQRNDERWFQEYDFPTLMSRTYDTPEYQKAGKIFLYPQENCANPGLSPSLKDLVATFRRDRRG